MANRRRPASMPVVAGRATRGEQTGGRRQIGSQTDWRSTGDPDMLGGFDQGGKNRCQERVSYVAFCGF
jgi:hypothetical protein